MTFTITKTKMAIGLIAIVTVAAAAALAAGPHPFNDVPRVGDPDERFYSEPVQWLWDNGLTTGSPSGSDTFKPLDNVTRGEYATFNFRYDKNIVQPGLAAVQADADAAQADADAAQAAADAAQADADANAADIATNTADIASNDSDIAALQADTDADTLDGYHANELIRIETDIVDADVNDWDGSTITRTVDIDAPTSGLLLVQFDTTFTKDAGETASGNEEYPHRIFLDGVQQGGTNWGALIWDEASWHGLTQTVGTTRAIPVSAGSYTVTATFASLSPGAAGELTYVYDQALVVTFVPFGGGGLTPLSLGLTGGPDGSGPSQ